MNTDMWNHPLTAKQLAVLGELGYIMIPPVEKKLACGVIGMACMRFVKYDRSIGSAYLIGGGFECAGNGGLATVDDILRVTSAQMQLLELSSE